MCTLALVEWYNWRKPKNSEKNLLHYDFASQASDKRLLVGEEFFT
jgi:hypothetical protein